MKTIFVSSTFKDMQLERDALQEFALPNINLLARKYGDNVAFCDLRWGVNTENLTEEEGNNKVLNVCLDVIDRCEPIMIVILGERYGWQPGGEKILQASQRKRMQLDDYEISVTALEIEYGSFHRNAKTLVYFRNVEGGAGEEYSVEDEEHAQKLAALKKRLASLAHGDIRNYTLTFQDGKVEGIKEFVAMVEQDVKRLLSAQWKEYEHLSPFGKERLLNQGIFTELAQDFAVGGAFKDTLLKAVDGGKPVLNVYGEAGSGKSTLMGALYDDLTKKGYDVLPVQVGSTAALSTSAGVLQYLLDYYKETCGITSVFDEEEAVQENALDKDLKEVTLMALYRTFLNRESLDGKIAALDDCAQQYEESGRHLVLLVDGVDNFHNDNGERLFCYIPESVSELTAFTLIFTTTEKCAALGYKNYAMPTFTEKENTVILQSILDKRNRELDDVVFAKLFEKCNGKPPLYLKLLLQKLMMMDARDFALMSNMQAISKHQQEVIARASGEIQSIAMEVLKEGAERINGNLLLPMLDYIAIAREGLTEEELRILLGDKFNQLDFYNFFAYMSDYFLIRRNGRYDFANAFIQQGFLNTSKDVKAAATDVVNLLVNKFFAEEVIKQSPDYAMVQEMLHITLTHCDEQLFFELALRFVCFDKLLKEQGAAEKYAGATYCTLVFGMNFDNYEELPKLICRLIDRHYASETEEEKQALLSVIDLFYQNATSNCEEFHSAYYALLSTLPQSGEYAQALTELSYQMLSNVADKEDREAVKGCLLPYLEHQKTYYMQILEGNEDVLEVLLKCIERFDKIVSIQYDDEDTVAMISEHIAFYQNYVITFLTNGAASLDDEILNVLGGQLLKLMYLASRLVEYNQDEESALVSYSILLASYEGTPKGYQEAFYESTNQSVGDLYETLGDLCKKVGKKTGDPTFLQEGINYYKKALAKKKKGEDFIDADLVEFLFKLDELYKLLGEKYKKQRIKGLEEILAVKDESVSVLGQKITAANRLFEEFGRKECAFKIVEYAEKSLNNRLEKYGLMGFEEVVDLMMTAFDIVEMKECVNDGAYIAEDFERDIRLALAICDSFPDDKKLQAAKVRIEKLFKNFA